jgi:hypothetical protein
LAGYQPAAGEDVRVQENRVGPRYFSTVGMHLLTGRDFTGQDRDKAPLVAIVNQSAARRCFPNGNAIGQRIGYGQPNVEIVGMVADARVNNEREAAPPMVFYPLAQARCTAGVWSCALPATRRHACARFARPF